MPRRLWQSLRLLLPLPTQRSECPATSSSVVVSAGGRNPMALLSDPVGRSCGGQYQKDNDPNGTVPCFRNPVGRLAKMARHGNVKSKDTVRHTHMRIYDRH